MPFVALQLSVVIYHMNLVGSITEARFFKGSYVFVELFFVLSGFVFTHSYGFKDNLKFSSFMKARFFRLYPLHLFMFFVMILIEFGKLVAFKYGGISFTYLPFTEHNAITEIIPNLLLIQSWVPFANAVSFNGPSWSISIEFYLYILFFLSIVIFGKYKKYFWIITSIITFYLMISESEVLGFYVLRGLLCFFGGSLTYLIYKKIASIKPKKIFGSIIEIVLVIFVIVVVQSDFIYKHIVISLLFCIVVLMFSFESGIISDFLKLKLFQVMGKLSYSIYMIHYAILFCFTATMLILQKLMSIELAPMYNGVRYLTFGNEIINNIAIFLILTFIIWLSQFTYKHIELKWQNIGRSLSHKANRPRSIRN